MEVRSRIEQDVEVLTISGRMTILEGAEPVRRRFERSLSEGRRHFLFDLRELLFLDSASIGEMIACFKRAREQSGSVKLLVAPGGIIDDVITLSGMDRIVDVFYDEIEAGLGRAPREPRSPDPDD